MESKNNRVLSGIKPSGKMHLGNYLGAVQNWVKLQDEYQCFFPVVDMHALTENYDAKELSRLTTELVIDLIAAGIDPERSVIFVQSQMPEHAELAWYFNTLTPVAFLERMTQYKDFVSRGHTANVGLFDYPVLQAADILLYKPVGVPVGGDQLQHLELTNELVKKFNNKFGKTFDAVKPLVTKTPRVMSLLEPTKKMSKSLGDNHVINLADEPAVIEKKLARAVTDTGKTKTISAGTKNLFALLEIFGDKQQYEFYRDAHQEGTIRYADLKANLAKLIAHHLSDYREKRKELEQKSEYILEVINKGREKAKVIASQTLTEVKDKMGLLRN